MLDTYNLSPVSLNNALLITIHISIQGTTERLDKWNNFCSNQKKKKKKIVCII